MGKQKYRTKTWPNGITLLAEEMPQAVSTALSILVPVGAAHDPDGKEGSALLLSELLHRGAGPFTNQQLSDAFEELGIQRHQSAGIEVSIWSAAMLPENLAGALKLYSHILLEPHLPDDELENVRELALQDIEALEDEPASKVMTELAKQFYPYPFGRSQLGTTEGVQAVSSESLKTFYNERFRNEQLVIAVAGKFDWDSVVADVEQNFSRWQGTAKKLDVPALSKKSSVHHLDQDTAQVQIALSYPSVSFGHAHYYTARVMLGVLSGGMAGRLFIEVREKRGLVYRVGASHSAARGRAAVFSYAGTTPENAQETLDVMLTELRGISNGVSDEELRRAKVDLKTALIMQSELSSARASALVNDWWNLGSLRQLDDIRSAIEAVSNENILDYLREFPVSPVTLVTLGPKKVELRF